MNRLPIYLIALLPVILLFTCQGGRQKNKLQAEVDRVENLVFADSAGIPERNLALELIQAYENYANAFPEDTLSPEYLFKGAEVAMNMNMSGRAIEYHQRILLSWPDYRKASYSLFLQAFIYENQMQQFETAKKLYQEFITRYPDHPLTDDARVSVENMGRSVEELIEAWEKQNK